MPVIDAPDVCRQEGDRVPMVAGSLGKKGGDERSERELLLPAWAVEVHLPVFTAFPLLSDYCAKVCLLVDQAHRKLPPPLQSLAKKMSTADQSSAGGGQSGTVDVTDLDVPQLQDVRRQLDQELQHLTQSFGQLKAAQTKFKTCVEAIDGMKAKGASSPV